MSRRNLICVWLLIPAWVLHQPSFYTDFNLKIRDCENRSGYFNFTFTGTDPLRHKSDALSAYPAQAAPGGGVTITWVDEFIDPHQGQCTPRRFPMTKDVTKEPVLQNPLRNLLTWHYRFLCKWCITFPALCTLFLKQSRWKTICREKPSICSQPKIAAAIFL